MRRSKSGQVEKFHIPQPYENPNQLYFVLEVIEDDERPWYDIKVLNTRLSFNHINEVNLDCLEVVEVDPAYLFGYNVTSNKVDYSQATVKVEKVGEKKIMIDLGQDVKGGETNVWLTIEDENVKECTGTLFLN
jgi:hypothetical protein